ncbi:hypothetical protein AD933_05295 [Acetobacter malorum]|uniref:Uncharacterized protein n=1 Tax=Acetobacter malorum TaxID=178901 RepID=A0A149RRT5_9PROT|nr:hypothetical protein [Acetobacter malorum]KXV16959.1 hypothetical protein AD933_05295 [Acetobacter malorum]
MAASIIILRSELKDLSLLGLRDKPVIQQYASLLQIVAASGVSNFSFCEPVVRWPKNDFSGEVSWYAPQEAPLVQLVTLPPQEQDPLLQAFCDMVRHLQGFMATLPPAERALLERALIVPDLSALYTDSQHFILAPWGAQAAGTGGFRIDPNQVDFTQTPIGLLLAPPEKTTPAACTPPATSDKKDDLAPASTPGAPAQTAPQEIPVSPIPNLQKTELSRPLRLMLLGLVFLIFFVLGLRAALLIAAHAHSLSLFGYTLLGITP